MTTMTNDPDLDQAIVDMEFTASALRRLQGQVRGMDPVKHYETIAARKTELADLEEEFRIRGERLKLAEDRRLAGRTLLLVVEQARDLKRLRRRAPSAREMASALRIVTDAALRDREEAEADLVLAQHLKLTAHLRASAGESAIAYLEASR